MEAYPARVNWFGFKALTIVSRSERVWAFDLCAASCVGMDSQFEIFRARSEGKPPLYSFNACGSCLMVSLTFGLASEASNRPIPNSRAEVPRWKQKTAL